MKKYAPLVCLLFISVFAWSTVNVTLSSPTTGTVGSPLTVKASATSDHIVTGWHIYLDNQDVYNAGTTSSIAASLNASTGTHTLAVRAWDSTGAYNTAYATVTVSETTTSGVNVTINSPAPMATVNSPLTVSASATSGRVITGWHIYLDSQDVYNAGATSTINAALNASAGTHTLTVRAWDSSGAYGTANETVTVSAPTSTSNGSAPVPPSNAVVYSKIEERAVSNWFSCRSLDCSGSNAYASYWVAPYQSSPSLDGSSTQFYVGGNAWADVLWAAKLGGAASAKTHFILDYWLKPNADTLTHAEALEFDVVFAYGGRKWDFSHQLHYSGTHFDTWDGAVNKWVHTSVPVPKLDPNSWHHIKIYGERVGTQTHNISLTVDSNTYQIPTQYAWHYTQTCNWANSVSVQVQIDVNGNPGTVSEYVDTMNLYLW
jgi:hypothetical protein